MPKTKQQFDELTDTWGRRNRKLADRQCPVCGKTFRPLRASSRFCSRPCACSRNGGHNKKPVSWWLNPKGYIEGRIWLDDGTRVYIKQHRFVAEGILGRPLLPTEDVHHKDGNKTNNAPDNLEIIDHGGHSRQTNARRQYRRGYVLQLTETEREARSLRAIAQALNEQGNAARAALKKVKGE